MEVLHPCSLVKYIKENRGIINRGKLRQISEFLDLQMIIILQIIIKIRYMICDGIRNKRRSQKKTVNKIGKQAKNF